MPTNRDIMELRGAIDPRLHKILLEMNGDIHAIRSIVSQLGTLMNNLADVMGQQQVVLTAMKPYIQKLKQMGMDVGSDPNITGEIDEK